MINKPFKDILLEDIESLKSNGTEEGKSLDFKLELHLENKKDRKEFAADITSFANTIGGDLIIGVSEEGGAIKEIHGIEVDNKDKFSLAIENALRDSIEPQITGLEMNFYPIGAEDKYILHIRIPQSYVGPHIANGEKFYARNTAGKYQLDFVEVKQRFTLSNQVQERIKQHHLERIMKIKVNEGYWELENEKGNSAILINIVPLQSFSESVFVSALTPNRFKLNPLFGDRSYVPSIQFEGIAGLYHTSYHHINRQGIIEIADKSILNIRHTLYGLSIIERILGVIPNAFYNFEELGINGPYVILTSILDVKDRQFAYDDMWPPVQLRQNDLILPSIFITDASDLSEYKGVLEELFKNTAGKFN